MHENTVKSPKLSESFTSVIKMFVLSRSFYLLIPNQVSLWEKIRPAQVFSIHSVCAHGVKTGLSVTQVLKKIISTNM